MEEIERLIARIRSRQATLAERRAAFDGVVARFQDMAYGCAYAVLGDAHLAEDAAQEAFLTAWREMSKLCDPAAFPGWFRRIVLTQCHRLTRGKRLSLAPLEAAFTVPADGPDPQAAAEKRELRERVREAIRALPEGERLATTLFYIGDYAYNDLAAFLEVPVTTVKQRLYVARKRLKGAMLAMMKEDLQEQRPSRDATFAERVQGLLRPLAEPDWEAVAALAHALDPDCPDIEVWLRNRRRFDETLAARRHYVAEDAQTRRVLGYGSIEQGPQPETFRLHLVVQPELLRRGVGDQLLARLLEDLRELPADTVWVREYRDYADLLAFLQEHGFTELCRISNLRLLVSEAETAALIPAGEQVAAQGIVLSTLAEERERKPEYLPKLLDFWNGIREEMTPPTPPQPYTLDYVAQRLRMPHILPEAYFIALDKARYIGVCNLRRVEGIRAKRLDYGIGNVRREYPQEAIGQALHLRALEYARQHGYQTLDAYMHRHEAETIDLYSRLGFRPHLEMVVMEKSLKA